MTFMPITDTPAAKIIPCTSVEHQRRCSVLVCEIASRLCCQMLALPPPSVGPPRPPSATHPGTRPPFMPSSGGVGSGPHMGAAVNGSSNARPTAPSSGTNQPSVTDIAAGASLLIASVVQGQYCVSSFHGLHDTWTTAIGH